MLKNRAYRLIVLLSGFIFLNFVFLYPAKSSADNIQNRSIQVGSAIASQVTSHTFRFTLPTTNNIGSISFEYCSNSPLIYFSCSAPVGLNVSAASLASQTGNTGFSVDNTNTTTNKIVLTRPSIAATTVPNTYVISNVTNPSTQGEDEFVRIATYASTDASGPRIDLGAVAFSVTSQFEIGAYIPPFLKLCVGITVAPDCSSQSGDSLDLGVLSTNAVHSGQSQFSTATNDPNGYVIYALGTTMTSGNNIIPAMSSLGASFPGTAQFGINLRANLIPGIGQDPVGVGSGAPTPNYNVPNHYIFNSGDSITTSNLPSDYNRMTVSYIANIASKQPPGIYSTTLTYVAVVQF